jgi:hypothetical protein
MPPLDWQDSLCIADDMTPSIPQILACIRFPEISLGWLPAEVDAACIRSAVPARIPQLANAGQHLTAAMTDR